MSRPLVLLHGFTGSPGSWARVVRLLPADTVVLTPALLGHDGSSASSGPESFEAEIERIARLIRSAVLVPAHLAGYSLGARVALGLLIEHPELFASATLSGVHPGLESPGERAGRACSDACWQQLLEGEGIEAFVGAWELQPLFASQQALSGYLLAEQRRERLAHHPRGLSRSLASLGLARMPAYGRQLDRIRVPVELLTGALDTRFSELAERLREKLPAARSSAVPGAGHNLVLERPALVAGTLRRGVEAG